MSDINFRVRGYPMAGGEEFLRENFKTEQEAKTLFEDLQSEKDSDSIITATPYSAIVLALEQFCNGEWTVMCKRLVRK